MSPKETKNVVASVVARLRNSAKSGGAPFQQVLQQYAIERSGRLCSSIRSSANRRYECCRSAKLRESGPHA